MDKSYNNDEALETEELDETPRDQNNDYTVEYEDEDDMDIALGETRIRKVSKDDSIDLELDDPIDPNKLIYKIGELIRRPSLFYVD
jgi:hypothetical protein